MHPMRAASYRQGGPALRVDLLQSKGAVGMKRADALKVACPKCGAPPRLPCMGRRGARLSCHSARHPGAWDGRKGPSKGVRESRCNIPGRIYFTRAEETRFIKIGWTKRSPLSRVRTLQTGCPHKLRLLTDMPGDQRRERSLHAAFSGLRVEGEWFRDEGALSDMIEAVLCGGPE